MAKRKKDKRTNNDLQNTTQIEIEQYEPYSKIGNSGAPEG
jgi:hypothetical protein